MGVSKSRFIVIHKEKDVGYDYNNSFIIIKWTTVWWLWGGEDNGNEINILKYEILKK